MNVPSLLTQLKVGDLHLPNRIIMAPLTRSRAGKTRLPNKLMAEYYSQRASAGLIISEATVVCPEGIGYADTPGIWLPEQTEAWKLVTRAVHEAGGRIFLQLWHCGRVSHPMFLNGALPVAPSPLAPEGHVSLVRPKTPFVVPRALEAGEIPGIVAAYKRGAQNAQEAGFDGVELHGANGYLLDQFLQDGANRRTDDYGGSIENRARLMFEAVDAAISVWGAGRVGLHLAPRGDAHSMGDSNPGLTFGHVAKEAGRRGLSFLCVRESLGPDSLGPRLKREFGGPYIANEKFTRESAGNLLARGDADAVAFGQLFIANPDLPRRFALNGPLNPPRPETFYGGDSKGYTDYPSLPPV